MALLVGSIGSLVYLGRMDELDDYTFVVNEDDVTVISSSKIEKDDDNQCIIKLYNGMQFEVPNDKQAYFIKDVTNEEDIEKYIHSVVGEDTNISYLYGEQDVKKKVRTKK